MSNSNEQAQSQSKLVVTKKPIKLQYQPGDRITYEGISVSRIDETTGLEQDVSTMVTYMPKAGDTWAKDTKKIDVIITDPETNATTTLELKRKPKPWWLILVAVALIFGAVIAYAVGSWRDPAAKKGYYEGKTQEEIQEDLDSKVDWYSMEISCASRIEMTEGETEAEARIENVAANHCDQRVKIYLSDKPDDILYESGAIHPGEYIQTVRFAHPLEVGTYDLTVEFQGYSQNISLVSDEGQLLGHDRFGASAAAEVTLFVRPSDVTYEQAEPTTTEN